MWLYRNLTCSNEEIWTEAKIGLARVVQHKLPKNIMQNSLKPMLSSLGAYNRMTPVMLQVRHECMMLHAQMCIGALPS